MYFSLITAYFRDFLLLSFETYSENSERVSNESKVKLRYIRKMEPTHIASILNILIK